jgi:hypothetical protein
MKWLSVYLPVPAMMILEIILSKKAASKEQRAPFLINVITGSLISFLLVWIWTLDQTNANDEILRHFLARILIVSTFLLLLLEWKFAKDYEYNSALVSLRILFVCLKLMLLLSGNRFQMPLILCVI